MGQTDLDYIVGQRLASDENSPCYIPIRHSTLSDGDVKVCRTTVRQNVQLLWEQTDLDYIVGRRLASDENSPRYIPIRHNTLSDGDVKVCRMTVPHG